MFLVDCAFDWANASYSLIYVLLGLFAIRELVRTFNKSNDEKSRLAQKVFLCLVILQSACRSAGLLGEAIYRVECRRTVSAVDGPSIWLEIGGSFPASLYISAFCVLIFRFARMYHRLDAHKSTLHWFFVLKATLLILNLALYTGYFVGLGFFHSPKADDVLNVTIAMEGSIEIAVGLCAAVYGALLLMLYNHVVDNGLDQPLKQSFRTSRSLSDLIAQLTELPSLHSRLRRVVVISLIVAVCFVLRGSFLVADVGFNDTIFLFVFYFLFAEVVPTASMLYISMFAPENTKSGLSISINPDSPSHEPYAAPYCTIVRSSTDFGGDSDYPAASVRDTHGGAGVGEQVRVFRDRSNPHSTRSSSSNSGGNGATSNGGGLLRFGSSGDSRHGSGGGGSMLPTMPRIPDLPPAGGNGAGAAVTRSYGATGTNTRHAHASDSPGMSRSGSERSLLSSGGVYRHISTPVTPEESPCGSEAGDSFEHIGPQQSSATLEQTSSRKQGYSIISVLEDTTKEQRIVAKTSDKAHLVAPSATPNGVPCSRLSFSSSSSSLSPAAAASSSSAAAASSSSRENSTSTSRTSSQELTTPKTSFDKAPNAKGNLGKSESAGHYATSSSSRHYDPPQPAAGEASWDTSQKTSNGSSHSGSSSTSDVSPSTLHAIAPSLVHKRLHEVSRIPEAEAAATAAESFDEGGRLLESSPSQHYDFADEPLSASYVSRRKERHRRDNPLQSLVRHDSSNSYDEF